MEASAGMYLIEYNNTKEQAEISNENRQRSIEQAYSAKQARQIYRVEDINKVRTRINKQNINTYRHVYLSHSKTHPPVSL